MTTTLDTPRVANLVQRLFAEDAASAPLSAPSIARLSSEERARMMRSKTDYLRFYGDLKDFPLGVSPHTGALLYMLARSSRAASVVEYGTSFGISTIHLAAALRDNGGGRVIASEFEPSKIARARQNLAEAGLADLVELREGDALQTLGAGLPATIDLVLLDGAKALYSDILDRLEPNLREGALIAADNADHCPEYLERVRAPGGGYVSVPFAEDVELSLRVRR